VCGILGLASTGLQSGTQALDAIERLRHRGPDSEGRFAAGPVAIAMRRLAIIDLETGDQPIANEAGDVHCVCNGEIYNFVELRAELEARGHRFSTASDVEVVVHLYEELGERSFERLRGMFAIALWDGGRERLVLARDRFGIKPLYLAEVAGGLAFASEIAPLLTLGARSAPDLQAIADFLSLGYVPGEATGIDGVRSLGPGRALVWEHGAHRELEFAPVLPASGPLADTLAEAVRIHLRSDVPLAVLLSGGLDSSLIAAHASEALGGGLRTFTVGFDDGGFDERPAARSVADAIGSEHHEVVLRPEVARDLPEIVRRLDEPNGDPSAIPLYYVCSAVAEDVKVALAGEGGDEVFGGYSRYAWDRYARLLGRLLPGDSLANLLEGVPGVRARTARSDRKDVVRRAVKLLRHAGLPTPERYFSWFALLSEDAKAELLVNPSRPTSRVFSQLLEAAPPQLSALARLQWVDLKTMLAKDLLVKADRMSMAHSLELRVPMLDERVVAAGLALPDRDKVRGVETKRAIRRLVEERLPREIARRPKQGFEVPIDRWLREDLAPLAKELLSRERISRRGLLRPEAVERRLRDHLAGNADYGLSLYGLLTLELWFEEVVEAAARKVAA
jgi:asparagine synthase (glutamine-hydrolysing)